MLHVRCRKGAANTQRGTGFWNANVFDRLAKAGWQFSIGVRMTKPVTAIVAQIDETAWQVLADYPDTGEAQIAESTLAGRRLGVRRVRLLLAAEGELFAGEWRHFAFATKRLEAIETSARRDRPRAPRAAGCSRCPRA